MKSESGFALVFRLGVMPMMLFSGAFFPIAQLPDAITWLAYITPIWHGVELCRDAHPRHGRAGCRRSVTWRISSLFVLVGWYLAVTRLRRRLAS